MENTAINEASEIAMLNLKAISIAKRMVAKVQSRFYEDGEPVDVTFSISPCYKNRAISWIMQNYPEYKIACNDVFTNASIITISSPKVIS